MEIGASASSVFGSATGADLLSVGAASPPSQAQEAARSTIESHQREINRIRGYKLQLSLTEKQKLSKLQVEIQEIDQRAASGLARRDELETRKELFNEADRIIGKPIVDAQADETLAELAGAIEALLQPKLDKARARQVERLERLKQGFEDKLAKNPDNRTLVQQFQSVTRLLGELKPLRQVSELSDAETRSYDDLVELVNERAGAKVELSSKDARRVAVLQRSIADLQGALPPDAAQQPTAAAVARAYVRLSVG